MTGGDRSNLALCALLFAGSCGLNRGPEAAQGVSEARAREIAREECAATTAPQNERISALRTRVSDMSIELADVTRPRVDLTVREIQQLSRGFQLADASMSAELAGVRVRGRIINANSIACTFCRFSLTIGGQTRDAVINRLPAGGSGRFDVYMPDLDPTSHWALLMFEGGTWRFGL
jgi:hypothetical protein